MLQRVYRLPAGIRLDHPYSISTSVFIAKFSGNNLPTNRYAFVVSKKVHSHAVERNSFKRRFRACLESIHSEFHSGFDIVFILKKEARLFTGDQYKQCLYELQKRLV